MPSSVQDQAIVQSSSFKIVLPTVRLLEGSQDPRMEVAAGAPWFLGSTSDWLTQSETAPGLAEAFCVQQGERDDTSVIIKTAPPTIIKLRFSFYPPHRHWPGLL